MNKHIEISGFLDRYKDFSKRLERQKIIHFKAKFTGLFNGYETLKNVFTIFDKKEAIQYNIFDILNINTAEVKTHTPFLKNLLDPCGTHGQTDLFLNLFIQNFIPVNKREYFVLPDRHDYYIEEEKSVQQGRIDIYIDSIDPKKKFGIIIENKLLAGDQYLQLSRYYDFIKNRRLKDIQIMIFYLTIDGTDPSTYSIDKKLMTELKERNILYNLSYRVSIKNWLQNSLVNVKSDKVKYLIKQYLKTIDYL